MTLEQYITNLQTVISGLEQEAERVSIGMAQTALSVVKNRSIANGIFVDGIKGNTEQYSTNVLPTFLFTGKERNQQGKKYINDNPLGNWGGFRKAQGLNSDNINLSYTNRMWSSITIIQTGNKDGVAYARLGTVDVEVSKYIGYLAARYGNFLRPTPEEERQIKEDGAREIISYIKQILNNG